MELTAYLPGWPEHFISERARLLNVLGEVTTGGLVENLQHIGATSVPGMAACPCIDIAMTVWPFPLQAQSIANLAALGYAPVAGFEAALEQRFRRADGAVQLYVVEPGSDRWTNYLLIRDYLRCHPAAQAGYQPHWFAHPFANTLCKPPLLESLMAKATSWWLDEIGFAPLESVATELAELGCPWYVSSGWALDLFLGRVTRIHHDVDIVLDRGDQLALQEYMTQRGWRFVTPFEQRLEPWPPHMRIETPRHQVHAHREGAFIDFLLSPLEQGVWRYRRQPTIVRDAGRISLRSAQGIPFLAPELVLLFKSKSTGRQERGKDQADFEQVHPHLEHERRAWLRWALIATEPAHPWIGQLG
jgi:GrpB-like predicted nucleotidyltransferase (UPF0157 family)